MSAAARPATSQPDRAAVFAAELTDRFLAQDQRPAEVAGIDLASLPAFVRSLVVCDSTVTTLIEAHTLRPLRMDVLAEETVELETVLASWLWAAVGTLCVRRRVVFRTEGGGPRFCAQTHVLPGRLPERVRAEIARERLGIGATLARLHVESSRHLLWFGGGAVPGWARTLPPHAPTVHRTYLIRIANRPVFLLNEDFCSDTLS